MDQGTFSSTLEAFADTITNERLLQTIAEIKTYKGSSTLPLFKWSDTQVALKVTMNVQLPPLGNDRGIDIRRSEPVLIVFNLKQYPSVAPWVCSDRIDYPAKRMGHMYVAKNGRPGGFCLVRGSMNEWYANKRPKDLLIRIENWLRDGATGELNKNGDQFEPLRLEGYSAKIMYDYDKVCKVVSEKKALNENGNYALALFERFTKGDATILKMRKIVTRENYDEVMEEFNKERQKHIESKSAKNYHFAYIVWSKGVNTFEDYCVQLPATWNELRRFCKDFEIDISPVEQQLVSSDENIFKLVPIIVAVKRPKPLIGFSGDIEFLNFFTFLEKMELVEGKLNDAHEVHFFQHLQPLTLKKAMEISGIAAEPEGITLLAGCGALGSKVAMHMGRGGLINTIHSDPDYLSPHNLVRHVAFADGEGQGKAEYVAGAIRRMFPEDETVLCMGFTTHGEPLADGFLSKLLKHILDFTASASFFNFLVKLKTEEKVRVSKGMITDTGNLGVLIIEGDNRNPRIDDLQASLYLHAFNDTTIEAWLQREVSQSTAAIDTMVGIGCNSETTILADDVVSYHASYMSCVLKIEQVDPVKKNGRIYLNVINRDPLFHGQTQLIAVEPFEVMNAVNEPTWEIRFMPGLIDRMLLQLTEAYPRETGGLFIGVANFKTKTVHVMGLIDAPPDSKSNPVCFYRGVYGLKGAVDNVTEKTGGQLGYIGEWHTHPHGPNGISEKDAQTMAEFKTDFEALPAPLPVFLTIVTTDGIFPYVY